jgi:TonB family protein
MPRKSITLKHLIRSGGLRPIALLAIGLLCFSHPFRAIGIIGGDEEIDIEKFAVKKVQPAYPAAAEKYRISGTVTVQISVAPDGKVMQAEMVRGSTVFRAVSLDAAKRWLFKPPTDQGLRGTIRFVFKSTGG